MVGLTATIEDLAGVEPGRHVGRSFCPLVADPPSSHRDAAFSEGGFLVSEEPLLESGDEGPYRHKQAIQHEHPELVGRGVAVRTEQWCYIERLYEGPELYDRRGDPRETTNLAGRPEHAAVQRELRDRIFRWLFETRISCRTLEATAGHRDVALRVFVREDDAPLADLAIQSGFTMTDEVSGTAWMDAGQLRRPPGSRGSAACC